MLIDGTAIAEKVLKELRRRSVPQKELAAVLVGDDAASLSFLKQKQRAAESLGVNFKLYQLPDSLAQIQLEKKIKAISDDERVGGMIVQLPLPNTYNRIGVLNQIAIEKDVDVLNGETSKVLAPAAGALERVLKEIGFSVADKNVVVVGSGLLIGRPIVNWLMGQTKKLSVVNRGGYDPQIVREADLVITGAGVPRLVKGDYIKHNAVVIDFGYGRDEADELAGDVDLKSVQRVAAQVTPTPGGMGPVVVAMLFSNFYQLAG